MNQKRKYTQQFKEDAVSVVLGGRAARQVSRDLGINVSLINRWKKLHLQEQDQFHDGIGQSPSEMVSELNALRREVAELREIITILKKTIKYVS